MAEQPAKRRRKVNWSLSSVRFSLCIAWTACLVVYALTFLILKTREGFADSEINDALWRVGSHFIPMLTTFVAFWSAEIKPNSGNHKVPRRLGILILALATIPYAGVLLFFIVSIRNLDFPLLPEESFSGIVREGFKYLLICSTLTSGLAAYTLKPKVTEKA